MPKVDFHHVEEHHRAVHLRLLNWARWVTPSNPTIVCPMFRQYRSHAWQWHAPEIRETVDMLDAQAIEKLVCSLPPKNRMAIKWAYVERTRPGKATRRIASSDSELARLIREGRQMLTQELTCVI